MTSVWARCSMEGSVPLKSKRVATSRRAWSTAFVSSAGSYWETTSNEYSGMGPPALEPVEDGVQAGDERRGGQRHDQQAAAAQHHGDPDLGGVDGLGTGLQLVG